MEKRWADLVALAEELDAACRNEKPSDVDLAKVRRLARGIIELPEAPAGPRRSSRPPSKAIH